MNKLTASRIRRTNGVSRFQNGISTTLAGLTCNISVVDGTAFVTNPSVDLTPYLGCRITLVDTAGLSLIGWVKAKGTGETYLETVVNGDMELTTSWPNLGSPTVNERSSEQAHGGTYSRKITATWPNGCYQSSPAPVTGALYTGSFWYYLSSGTTLFYTYPNATWLNKYSPTTTWTQATMGYSTRIGGGYVMFSPTGEKTAYIDDVSILKVLTPSATGVTITNSPGGSVFNWAAKHPSFNPNSATFNAIIRA